MTYEDRLAELDAGISDCKRFERIAMRRGDAALAERARDLGQQIAADRRRLLLYIADCERTFGRAT